MALIIEINVKLWDQVSYYFLDIISTHWFYLWCPFKIFPLKAFLRGQCLFQKDTASSLQFQKMKFLDCQKKRRSRTAGFKVGCMVKIKNGALRWFHYFSSIIHKIGKWFRVVPRIFQLWTWMIYAFCSTMRSSPTSGRKYCMLQRQERHWVMDITNLGQSFFWDEMWWIMLDYNTFSIVICGNCNLKKYLCFTSGWVNIYVV